MRVYNSIAKRKIIAYHYSNSKGDKSLEQKQPEPTWLPTDTVHIKNCSCKQ